MEERIAKQNRLAELNHMKDLFRDFLPVGEDRSQIDKTFFELEELICTKGSFSVQDDFDHESVVNPCSGSTEHDGNGSLPREYTYYAPHLSKLQAQHDRRQREPDSAESDPEHRDTPQDVEDASHAQGYVLPIQDESSTAGHLPHLSEYTAGGHNCEFKSEFDSYDSQGELQRQIFGGEDQQSHG